MITNERQYKITKSEHANFTESIKLAREHGPDEDVDLIVHEAMIAGLVCQADELLESLKRYESIRDGVVTSSEMADISDMGLALIEARIAAGMTQKTLAELLEAKEQQIQRWESSRYEGTNLRTVSKVLMALGATSSGSTIQFSSAKLKKPPQVQEVLLVGSKVKATLREAGYGTGGGMINSLDQWVTWLIKQAIARAAEHGRTDVTNEDIDGVMRGIDGL